MGGTVRLIAVGSRGDVDPYALLAGELAARGHRVALHAPEPEVRRIQAEDRWPAVELVAVPGGELFPRTATAHQLVLAQAGLSYLYLAARYRSWSARVSEDVLASSDPRDTLVCGWGSAALARSWWAAGRTAALVALADPGAPLAGSRASLVSLDRLRRGQAALLWRMTGALSASRPAGPPQRRPRPVAPPERRSRQGPVPVILAVSDVLCPEPPFSPVHAVRTGHLIEAGTVPAAGAGSGAASRPRVYVGFGSMADPGERLLRRWAGAAEDLGCEVVTQRSGSDTDHPALFPCVDAVVHHAGAGTTVTGLLAARPTVTVPHLGDQFTVARAVHRLGLGPPPASCQWLPRSGCRHRLEDALTSTPARERALRRTAERLASENGLVRTADACEWVIGGASLR